MSSVNSRSINIIDSLSGKRTKSIAASAAASRRICKPRSPCFHPRRTQLLQDKPSRQRPATTILGESADMDDASRDLKAAQTSGTAAGNVIWKCSIRSTTPLVGDTGARLSLIVVDTNSEVQSSEINVDLWRPPTEITKSDGTRGWEREGAVRLSAEITAPGAVKVRKRPEKGVASQDYIETITLVSATSVHTVTANSWVSSNHGWRVFFSGSAYLPKDTPAALRAEREDELKALQGKKETRVARRKDTDRIYWFQTYNDLSSGKSGNLVRPVLGGTKELPYPRRLATNRGNENDGREKAPAEKQEFWLQQDDKFSFDKKEDFQGASMKGNVEAIMAIIKEAAETNAHSPIPLLQTAAMGLANQVISTILHKETPLENFEDFEDVLAMYKKYCDHSGADFKKLLPTKLYNAAATASADETKTVTASRFKTADGAWNFQLSPAQAAEVDKSMAEQRVGPVYESATGTPAEGTRSIFAGDAKPDASQTEDRLGHRLWRTVKDTTTSINNFLSFNVPRVLDGRPDAWHLDEEFGRQMVAGYNPLVITALKQLPESFGSAIRGSHVNADLQGSTLEQLVSEAAAGGKPRLYLVDYWALSAFWDEMAKDPEMPKKKVQHAGRVVMYLRKDKDGNDRGLIPVAIELAHLNTHRQNPKLPPTAGIVYSRSQLSSDPVTLGVWRLAKMIFKSLDSSVHQLGSHWNRTHCALEPFYISLRRQISVMHPVYKLMAPHFRYTLQINRDARMRLINAGGVIEQIVPSDKYAMLYASALYRTTWNFTTEALPEDLKARGMLDPATGKPWLDYPYATDGLDMWSALTSYFDTYLRLYYKSDAEVLEDPELQAWWKEVKTEGHPDLLTFGHRKNEEELWGFTGPIPSIDKLQRVLATIAWVASGHHAAVNFGQYDYTSFILNTSSLSRRPMPEPGDAGWKELTAARPRAQERIILTYLADPLTALKVSSTTNVLSTHSRDEQTLDEVNELLVDPEARAANQAFITAMKQLERQIEMRNADVRNWARFGLAMGDTGGPLPYTLLSPGSQAGVTMRGVPYSVSI